MGRPSNRKQRREQILAGFARVLSNHGYAGATIASIAAEANLTPGLLHYHFKNKEELLSALIKTLLHGFRTRQSNNKDNPDPLVAYAEAALAHNDKADIPMARCWVGIFAQAIASPVLFKQFRRLIDREILHIQALSKEKISSHDAATVLAFMIGSLVLGAFAPKTTAGFAAPALIRIIANLKRGEL